MANIDLGAVLFECRGPAHLWVLWRRHGRFLHKAARAVSINAGALVQKGRPNGRVLDDVVHAAQMASIGDGFGDRKDGLILGHANRAHDLEAGQGQFGRHLGHEVAVFCADVLIYGPPHARGLAVPAHTVSLLSFSGWSPAVEAEEVPHGTRLYRRCLIGSVAERPRIPLQGVERIAFEVEVGNGAAA